MTTALVLQPEGRFSIEQRPDREPGPGEALVSIIATGICGSDVHGAAGHTGRRTVGQVMGHETVGRVAAVGDGVDADWMGALVAIDPVVSCGECAQCLAGAYQHCETGWVLGVRADVDAAYASDVVVPERNLVRLPDDMPNWHGALIEPLAVGYHAARRGGAQPGDRVLIIGGGPIGQAVAIACRRLGVEAILVSEPDDVRGAFIEEQLGFVRTAPDRLAEAVAAELGGSVTLAFDAVGTDRTIDAAFAHSAPMARIVLVGMDSPKLAFPAYGITARERTVIGTICSTREHFRETAAWAADNPEIVGLLADVRLPLESGPEAFAGLIAGELRANKVLLMPLAE